MRFWLFAIIFSMLTWSCYRPSQREAFEDMKQLEGTWVSIEGVQFYESWTVISDSLISGKGYSLNGVDTLFSEQLKIYRNGDFVLYAAKVGDNEDYVYFPLKAARERSWTFQNPVHDYPNIIEYSINRDTILTARTTNIKGNKPIEFKLRKARK